MKKTLVVLMVVALVVGQLAFASNRLHRHGFGVRFFSADEMSPAQGANPEKPMSDDGTGYPDAKRPPPYPAPNPYP